METDQQAATGRPKSVMHSEAKRSPLRLSRLLSASILLLATIGMLISGYLTYIHLQNLQPICGELGDCEVVNSSVYSEVNGVPVALLGFLAYAALFILSLLNLRYQWHYRSLTSFTIFSLALVGVLYSAYLTYIELFVLHAICVWCVGSAVTISIILILSIVLLVKGPRLFKAG